MQQKLKSENPPLYFVPTRVMCGSCGQLLMNMEEGNILPDLYIIVVCMQPFCAERSKEKKIDLKLFSFREYVDLSS